MRWLNSSVMCIDPAIAALETVNAVLEAADSALVKVEARRDMAQLEAT